MHPRLAASTVCGLLGAPALTLALTSPALADVTITYSHDSTHYDFKCIHMPDFDQRRNALPNNGGMYCVPTAAVNLFAYAGNHGLSWVAPGAGNWQSNANYNYVTNQIALMGAFMGTSGTGGTNGAGLSNGLAAWTLLKAPGLVCVQRAFTEDYTPTAYQMSKRTVKGWKLSFVYGYWKFDGTEDGHDKYKRNGGHAVTLVRNKRNGSYRAMLYRDPADDNADLNSQSLFASKMVKPYNLTGIFGDMDDFKTVNAIDDGEDPINKLVIDGYYGIKPSYGLHFQPGSLQAGGGAFKTISPLAFAGDGSTADSPPIPSDKELDDYALFGDLEEAIVLAHPAGTELPTQLFNMDLLTGEFVKLDQAPEGVVRMTVSRQDAIYVQLASGKLHKLNALGEIKGTAEAPFVADDMEFDNANDILWMISAQQHRLYAFDTNLQPILQLPIHESVQLTLPISLSVDPTSGRAWFKPKGSDHAHSITQDVAGGLHLHTINLPTMPDGAKWMQFGDGGALFVGNGTIMKVMRKDAEDEWTDDTDSRFYGINASGLVVMATSRSNWTRGVHDTPEWASVPAEQAALDGIPVADCDADLNGDDIVDGGDLGILLGQWNAPNATADLTGDGTVDGADLGALLGEWGPCQ